MAFQLTVDPDLEAKLWYQGIMEGAKGFSQGIDKAGQGLAAGLKEQKERARMFKSLQEYADASGIASKDKTTPMDLDSLKGYVEGSVAKQWNSQQLDKLKMDAEAHNQRMAEGAMRLTGMQQAQSQEGKRQAFIDDLATPLSRADMVGRVDESGATIPGSMPAGVAGMVSGQVPPVTNARIFESMKKTGYAPPLQDTSALMRSIREMNPEGGAPVMTELPGAPDYQVFHMPGTKQMDVRPKLSGLSTSETIYSEDGVTPAGQVVRAGGKLFFRNPEKKIATQFPAAVDENGKPIPGLYVNPNDGKGYSAKNDPVASLLTPDAKSDEPGPMRRMIGKIFGGGSAPVVKAPLTPKKGMKVTQDGHVYEYDGKNWVPVQ